MPKTMENRTNGIQRGMSMYQNGGFVLESQCGSTVGNEDLNGSEYQDGVGLPVMVVISSIHPKTILACSAPMK